MEREFDTVIVGAGQAGLSVSYYLGRDGREHVVLERDRIGESWRSRRWDSFTLVTPNWMLGLPGAPYDGEDPDGFLARDEVVDYLEDYARAHRLPVRTGVEVIALEPSDGGYHLATAEGSYRARNVVVAVGTFQRPGLPRGAADLPDGIAAVHSSAYRNPSTLPPGGVLVVGSGQSGCQIAEELVRAGRDVTLAAGGAISLPRRYRGRDLMFWAEKVGMFDRTVDELESPKERFAPNPQATGRDGGHDLGLHTLARDGVRLAGRFQGFRGRVARFAPDLHGTLVRGDEERARLLAAADQIIEVGGLDAPAADPAVVPGPRDGYEAPERTELDLDAEGVRAVVWATGYTFDFGWIELPVLDDAGYPEQERGVTRFPGLYFAGLHWLHTLKSGLFYGVAEDARHVVEAIAGRPAR
jgi:putative flavoprotein involved in K+ transport